MDRPFFLCCVPDGQNSDLLFLDLFGQPYIVICWTNVRLNRTWKKARKKERKKETRVVFDLFWPNVNFILLLYFPFFISFFFVIFEIVDFDGGGPPILWFIVTATVSIEPRRIQWYFILSIERHYVESFIFDTGRDREYWVVWGASWVCICTRDVRMGLLLVVEELDDPLDVLHEFNVQQKRRTVHWSWHRIGHGLSVLFLAVSSVRSLSYHALFLLSFFYWKC